MRFSALLIGCGVVAFASSGFASTPRLDAALFEAAQRGDLQAVQKLVARGANVNARDDRGQTPLQVAAFESDNDAARFGRVLRFLIDKGADVNARDEQGGTALLRAVLQNRLCTEILLNRGADVNARTKKGDTALMWAAGSNEDLSTVRLLLQRGALLNARDQSGESSLSDAIGHGKIAVARFLIDQGAPVNQSDSEGETPLMTASRGQVKKVKLLLSRGAKIDARDKEGKTALLHGSYDSEVVGLLLARGAEINARDKEGQTALMLTDNSNVVALLVKRGAKTEFVNRNGETALLLAVKSDAEQSGAKIRGLIESKVNIDARDASGQTALMHTIYRNDLSDKAAHALAVARSKWLVRHGAGLDLRDNMGKTALIIAARWNNLEIARMLVARSANLELRDRNGNSALDWAKARRNTRIVRLFPTGQPTKLAALRNPPRRTMAQQRLLNDAFIDAAEQGDIALLKRAIDQGASLEAQRSWISGNPFGETPLVAAADGDLGEGNPESVRFLLEQGAKVNGRGREGQTALMTVVGSEPELLSLLLRAGADVNARDKNGETALMSATHIFTHDGDTVSDPAAIRILLRHGARANLRSKQGKTALDFARELHPNAPSIALLRQAMRREIRFTKAAFHSPR